MIGTRVYVNHDGHLILPTGGYGQDREGVWWIRPPCGSMGPLTDHEIIEHEDHTITVSPSILLPEQWHGFLEHGVWREA